MRTRPTMERRTFLKLGAAATAAGALGPLGAGTDFAARLPACELVRRFRSGALSPVDVLLAQGMRRPIAGRASGRRAMGAARESERRYREGIPRRLEGITVGADRTAPRSVLRSAGAIVVPVRGRVDAAVAAGLVTVGVSGIPASVPGIYAYERPQRRIESVERLLLGSVAPLTRSLPDMLRMERALTRRGREPEPRPVADITGTRIAVAGGAGAARLAGRLAALGAQVDEFDLGSTTSVDLHRQVFGPGAQVLALPARPGGALREALAWHAVARLPGGELFVGTSCHPWTVMNVAAAWTNHQEV